MLQWAPEINSTQDDYDINILRRSDGVDFSGSESEIVTGTTGVVSGLFPGASYEFSVVAISGGVLSAQSDTIVKSTSKYNSVYH